jgi:uncharacterized protein YlxP (DUF503 family)
MIPLLAGWMVLELLLQQYITEKLTIFQFHLSVSLFDMHDNKYRAYVGIAMVWVPKRNVVQNTAIF